LEVETQVRSSRPRWSADQPFGGGAGSWAGSVVGAGGIWSAGAVSVGGGGMSDGAAGSGVMVSSSVVGSAAAGSASSVLGLHPARRIPPNASAARDWS